MVIKKELLNPINKIPLDLEAEKNGFVLHYFSVIKCSHDQNTSADSGIRLHWNYVNCISSIACSSLLSLGTAPVLKG